MEDMLFLIILFGSDFFILILVCISIYNYEKRDKYKDQQIINYVDKEHLRAQKQMLIEQIRTKVLNGEYSSYQKASMDLTSLFADSTNHLRLTYPELTDIDICVLQLLAIGLDNQEILTFMDMSKRTFYKRRQLIAGRVGLLASQLDQFAYANIK